MKKNGIILVFVISVFVIAGCAQVQGGEAKRVSVNSFGEGGKLVNGAKVGGLPHLTVKKRDGNEIDYDVEIADTYEERRTGLMFRESMGERSGMFFVFETPAKQSFWMKNTLIPLDMIFVDSGYKILNVAKNVPPCEKDPCATYSSEGMAKYVLEVNAGEAEKWGIGKGDSVNLSY